MMHLRLITFILGFGLTALPGVLQQGPITFDSIINDYVRKGIGIGFVESVVKRQGVVFVLTDQQKDQLKQLAPPGRYTPADLDSLITTIKESVLLGDVQIGCKPVDCRVLINNELVGQTTSGVLKRKVLPGQLNVDVMADGYTSQHGTARVEPNKTAEANFVLPLIPPPAPKTGTVVVICDAGKAECLISLETGAQEKTTQNKYTFPNVSIGGHSIKLGAEGFVSETVPITVTAGQPAVIGPISLKAALPDPQVVFPKILAAVGRESNPRLTQAIQVEAASTITHKTPGSSAAAQKVDYIESVMTGKWIRWDVALQPDGRMMLASLQTAPTQTSSDGDPQFIKLSVASDLTRAFETLQRLRLPQLLPSLNDAKYKKEIAKIGVLSVTGPDGAFEISYDEQFRPTRIQQKSRAGLPVADITYAKYQAVGGWTLPFSMTVRYTDIPEFVQEIQYRKYCLGADLQEQDISYKYNQPYKGNGKENKGLRGINLWAGAETKCFP
jgi:hypothetical protein